MLKSKRDESIKRYLGQVGKLDYKSKVFESRYYKISYDESTEIIIRFSDHFKKNESQRSEIDIIKTSVGFYIIKTKLGTSVTLGESTIMPYLKSLLLVYPEIFAALRNFKKSSDDALSLYAKAVSDKNKLEKQFIKKSEEFELADEIWEKNKQLTEANISLSKELKIAKDNYEAIKKKHEKLTKLVKTMQSFQSQLNDFFKK